MRYSQNGDKLAESIAFVVARALWLAYQAEQNGPHRARDREIESLQMLLARLDSVCPDSLGESYRLAEEHHAHTLRNRESHR